MACRQAQQKLLTGVPSPCLPGQESPDREVPAGQQSLSVLDGIVSHRLRDVHPSLGHRRRRERVAQWRLGPDGHVPVDEQPHRVRVPTPAGTPIGVAVCASPPISCGLGLGVRIEDNVGGVLRRRVQAGVDERLQSVEPHGKALS
eukprot:SAG22_NODE_4804_length_1160_cov_1.020735_1_plen_145_part_00